MITRRGVLRVAVQGLAGGFGSAMAQQPKRKVGGDAGRGRRAIRRRSRADERINDVLAPIRDEHHLPGLIGAILTGDGLAAIGAVGIRKIGSPEPIQVTDQVPLASCTKSMTATLAGLLVDEGKLKWGSTIAEVFPDQADRVHARIPTGDAQPTADAPRGPAPPVPLGGARGADADRATHVDLDEGVPGPAPPQAGLGVRILERRLRAGRADGREGHRPVVERPDDEAALRAAGDVLGGLRHRGPARDRRAALGPSRGQRPVPSRCRPTAAAAVRTGRRGAMLAPRLGPIRRARTWPAPAGGRGCSRPPRSARCTRPRPASNTPAAGSSASAPGPAAGRCTHGGTNSSFFVTVWLAPALNLGFLAAANQGGQVAEKAVDQAIAALIKASELPAEPITPGS